MIRYISFDLWNTLIRSHPQYKLLRAKLLTDFINRNYDHNEKDLFLRIKDIEKSADKAQELTGLQLSTRDTLAIILGNLSCSGSITQADLFQLEYELGTLFVDYPPELIDGLATVNMLNTLRESGYVMGILSNTCLIPGTLLEELLLRTGIKDYFKVRIYSDRLGTPKPHFKAYRHLVLSFNCKASELLHIGDNIITDGGCTQYGIQSLQISKDREPYQLLQLITQKLKLAHAAATN